MKCGNTGQNSIQFSLQTLDTRLRLYRGEIFDYEDDSEDEDKGGDEPTVKVGEIVAFYVDRIRIVDKGWSLYTAMDDISSDTRGCYEGFFDQDSGDWKPMPPRMFFFSCWSHMICGLRTRFIARPSGAAPF
jgi:hypothetical protein